MMKFKVILLICLANIFLSLELNSKQLFDVISQEQAPQRDSNSLFDGINFNQISEKKKNLTPPGTTITNRAQDLPKDHINFSQVNQKSLEKEKKAEEPESVFNTSQDPPRNKTQDKEKKTNDVSNKTKKESNKSKRKYKAMVKDLESKIKKMESKIDSLNSKNNEIMEKLKQEEKEEKDFQSFIQKSEKVKIPTIQETQDAIIQTLMSKDNFKIDSKTIELKDDSVKLVVGSKSITIGDIIKTHEAVLKIQKLCGEDFTLCKRIPESVLTEVKKSHEEIQKSLNNFEKDLHEYNRLRKH